METIKDVNELKALKSTVSTFIKLEEKIPNQVFIDKKYFLIVDFTAVSTKKFFNTIIEIIRSQFVFYSIVPDPEIYYYNFFGKYNVFKFDFFDNSVDYLNCLHEKPKVNSADSIMDIVDIFVLFSYDREMIVYGDRDFDFMIIGFEDEAKRKEFIKVYGENNIFSKEDLKELNFSISNNFLESMKLNYFG